MKILLSLFIFSSTLLLQGALLENRNTAYDYHLQGMAADQTGVYWTFTYDLIKTDYKGKVIKAIKLPKVHCGDMCIVDGDIFVSAFFNDRKLIAANNNYKSAIYRFDKDLKLKKRYTLPIQQTIDGITFHKGTFYVALRMGNVAKKETVLMLFDKEFKFQKKLTVPIHAMTKYAAQNLTMVNGRILGAFYAKGPRSPLFDPSTLKIVSYINLKPDVGMAQVPVAIAGNSNTFLVGRLLGKNGNWKCSARIVTISSDNKVKNATLKNIK